jgi:hypothetical protein
MLHPLLCRAKKISFRLGVAVLLPVVSGATGHTQSSTTAANAPGDAQISATLAQVEAVKDSFVKSVAAAGRTCSIAEPKIVIKDVSSFGSYDPETNTLQTPAWEQMTDQEKALFYHAVRPDTSEAAAREEFEKGVHHWVIVHELGHWWQACRGASTGSSHYATEFDADRIAAAYWRERDPSIVAHQRAVFDAIVTRWPNPLPAGQDSVTYFNANYEKLGPTRNYIWFQAQMCLKAIDEKPAPTFTEALR